MGATAPDDRRPLLPGPPEKWDEDETPCCDACGYPAPLTEYPEIEAYQHPEGRAWRRCTVCSHTMVGQAVKHPRQYEDVQTMKLVAWGVNYLRDCATESALVCAVCMYTTEGVAAPAETVIGGMAVCGDHNSYVSGAMSQVIASVRRDQASAPRVPPS